MEPAINRASRTVAGPAGARRTAAPRPPHPTVASWPLLPPRRIWSPEPGQPSKFMCGIPAPELIPSPPPASPPPPWFRRRRRACRGTVSANTPALAPRANLLPSLRWLPISRKPPTALKTFSCVILVLQSPSLALRPLRSPAFRTVRMPRRRMVRTSCPPSAPMATPLASFLFPTTLFHAIPMGSRIFSSAPPRFSLRFHAR